MSSERLLIQKPGISITCFLLETSLASLRSRRGFARQVGAARFDRAGRDRDAERDASAALADRPRFETAMLTFFACTGLAMAIIGLYGVVAFMAVQRTQEIGIRMALGATRANVMRLILREGFRLTAIGGAVGLAAALGLSRRAGERAVWREPARSHQLRSGDSAAGACGSRR